jgi:hypothetical protein
LALSQVNKNKSAALMLIKPCWLFWLFIIFAGFEYNGFLVTIKNKARESLPFLYTPREYVLLLLRCVRAAARPFYFFIVNHGVYINTMFYHV